MSSPSGQAPQQHIADLRARLLDAHTPGDSDLEAYRHERVDYDGVPVTAEREQVAAQARRARRDAHGHAQERASRILADERRTSLRGRRSHRPEAVALLAGLAVGFVAGARWRR